MKLVFEKRRALLAALHVAKGQQLFVLRRSRTPLADIMRTDVMPRQQRVQAVVW
ncbi:MAG TPA: hypothetical protein VI137_02125 [Pseudolabrys sp.]|jgi:hypothetical protein